MNRTGVNPVIEQSTDAAIQLIEVVREKGTTKFKKYDQIKQANLSMMFADEKVRNKKAISINESKKVIKFLGSYSEHCWQLS